MQLFKTISFPDNGPKTVTISFSQKEESLYTAISPLSSNDIRELIGVSSYALLSQMADNEHRTVSQQTKFLASKALSHKKILASEVTFKAGKCEPFQRWYPYIEGYSPSFVKTLIETHNLKDTTIYEPFAGTGTTIFACDNKKLSCWYSEINPLLRFLISTKISIQSLSIPQRNLLAENFLKAYKSICLSKIDVALKKNYHNVFGKSKYFEDDTFDKILQYSQAIKQEQDSLIRNLLSIAVASILVPVSLLKKQGDLRFKTPKELATEQKSIEEVLPAKVNEIYEDILNFEYLLNVPHCCCTPNAKKVGEADCPEFGAVITSPPYLNGTNYIRNTKLELWFLGYLKSEEDMRFLRDEILTSGINDVKAAYRDAFSICNHSPLLKEVVANLNVKAYDKRIPLMAVCYFNEMRQVFKGIASKLRDNATVLIDLGDSIFSGVHIPTDKILIEIFEQLGYHLQENHILRTRRSRNGSVLSQFLITFKYRK